MRRVVGFLLSMRREDRRCAAYTLTHEIAQRGEHNVPPRCAVIYLA
jgi:hypothetical protein